MHRTIIWTVTGFIVMYLLLTLGIIQVIKVKPYLAEFGLMILAVLAIAYALVMVNMVYTRGKALRWLIKKW